MCRQQTAYTCGPAAAVTGLKKLGVESSEGDLAIAMGTCPALGTQSDVMAAVLAERFGKQGVSCDYRTFGSIAELPRNVPTLAVIRYNVLIDHFIVVLGVTDDQVTVGDPLNGTTICTHAEFARIWKFSGIVLRKG
ncbi:MAG: cysteine peptidase family C39 domain-containing protein [Verrucomicrobiota bacterium]